MCDVDASTVRSDSALKMKGDSFMTQRYARFSSAISGINQYIQKIESDEMKKYNLRGSCAQYLVAILSSSEDLTATRLSEICRKDKAAVSRTLAELEQAGMILRCDREGRRYRANLKLTEKGMTVARNVNRLVYLAVQKASEGYDMESRQTFVNVLNLIAGNLQTICRDGLNNVVEAEK